MQRLLATSSGAHPAFDAEMTIPANGMEDGWFQDRMETKPTIASSWHSPRASGSPPARRPWWGAEGRLGNVGDGNILMSHGIPTVQYGAGDIRIYKEWPTPDERVLLTDLVTAAKAVAYATVKLCG